MPRRARCLSILLVAALLGSCLPPCIPGNESFCTLVPYSAKPLTQDELPRYINVGDTVWVESPKREVHIYKVTGVGPQSFSGLGSDQKPCVVRYDEIAYLKVRRPGDSEYRDPRAPR